MCYRLPMCQLHNASSATKQLLFLLNKAFSRVLAYCRAVGYSCLNGLLCCRAAAYPVALSRQQEIRSTERIHHLQGQCGPTATATTNPVGFISSMAGCRVKHDTVCLVCN